MEKVQKHKVKCWLVNTGWVGDPYGKGERIKIAYSRAFIKNILSGDLDKVEYERDPRFGFLIPKSCPEVPAEALNPRNSARDKDDYDKRAEKLAQDFKNNFKQFEPHVSAEIIGSCDIDTLCS